jgi:hypothetical protein
MHRQRAVKALPRFAVGDLDQSMRRGGGHWRRMQGCE